MDGENRRYERFFVDPIVESGNTGWLNVFKAIDQEDLIPDGVSVSGVDGGELRQFVEGSNGGLFKISEVGTFTFRTNGEFDYLLKGQSATSSVTYTVVEPSGESYQATAVVTIEGQGGGTLDLTPPPEFETLIPDEGVEEYIARNADVRLGGSFDDWISGVNGTDLLFGGAGDDVVSTDLYGGVAYGGDGNDRLFSVAGSAVLDGGDGDDTLAGGIGEDILLGGTGNDIILNASDSGIPQQEIFDGSIVNAISSANSLNDHLFGGDGEDTFIIRFDIASSAAIMNEKNVLVDTEEGIDWEKVGGLNDNRHDHWVDSIGNDTIYDYSADDALFFVGHTIAIDGINGRDVDGDSTTTGITHVDVDGDGQNDTVIRFYSHHVKDGQAQAHHLDDLGSLTILGHELSAEEVSEAMIDVPVKQAGLDSYPIKLRDGNDTHTQHINSFLLESFFTKDEGGENLLKNARDVVESISPNSSVFKTGSTGNSFQTFTVKNGDVKESTNYTQLPKKADGFKFDNDPGALIFGTAGEDDITSRRMGAYIDAGAGNDEIKGSNENAHFFGSDYVHAGDGNDSVNGGYGHDILYGEAGDDTLEGGDHGHDILIGGDGNDLIVGGNGHDVAFGGNGEDTIYLSDVVALENGLIVANGIDELQKDSGNNIAHGGDGNDTIFGSNIEDIVEGGNGDDIITGEGGADTFVFSDREGHDTVTDFSADDKIDLSGHSNITSWDDLESNHTGQDGSDVIISHGWKFSITLEGVAVSDLSEDQFIFG